MKAPMTLHRMVCKRYVASSFPLTSSIDSPPSSNPLVCVPPFHTSYQPKRYQSDSHLHTSARSPSPNHTSSNSRLENLHTLLWRDFTKQLDQTTTMDSAQRFTTIFESLQSTIVGLASPFCSEIVSALRKWKKQCSASALEIFLRNRDTYSACPDASLLLSTASVRMYKFVRKELGIPFLRTSIIRDGDGLGSDPLNEKDQSTMVDESNGNADGAKCELTTGELITIIYQSIRTGALYSPVIECLGEVEHKGQPD